MDQYLELLTKLGAIADKAYADTLRNYWKVCEGYSCFHNHYKENRDTLSDLGWNYVMMLLAYESYYLATGDESFKYYLSEQTKTYYTQKEREWVLATGKGNNPAHDDAAWTAMGFLLAYKILGDERALEYCHDMIKNAYDYWQDGSNANGSWYSYPEDNNGHIKVKSTYCAGFLVSELEYYELTKGTEREDAELHRRTLELYCWVENHMRRSGHRMWNGIPCNFNDNLYFCEFIDNKDKGEFFPRRFEGSETEIKQAGSWSCLFGNTAMAVVNKRLYDATGNQNYLDKALSTANALVHTAYNNGGAILNDRDAWTNCAFMGYFVREVLPLDGIEPELGRMILKTAADIMKNTYYEGGFYGSDWDGSGIWLQNDSKGGGHTRYIAANATTVHMIFAAYAALKNGSIKPSEDQLSLFDGPFVPKKLDEKGMLIK